MESANKFLIAGLAFLGIAIVLAMALISDLLYNGLVVWLTPVVTGGVLVFVWFIRPLLRGDASSGP